MEVRRRWRWRKRELLQKRKKEKTNSTETLVSFLRLFFFVLILLSRALFTISFYDGFSHDRNDPKGTERRRREEGEKREKETLFSVSFRRF